MKSKLGAALAAALCSLALVLVVGQASASPITFTLSLTDTAGGATLVGESDSVLSLDLSLGSAGTAGTFVARVDKLSVTIREDVIIGRPIFEMEFRTSDQAVQPGTYSFQDVLLTRFDLNLPNELVSFVFATWTFTPVAVPGPRQ
jgi:hypothetical protein